MRLFKWPTIYALVGLLISIAYDFVFHGTIDWHNGFRFATLQGYAALFCSVAQHLGIDLSGKKS